MHVSMIFPSQKCWNNSYTIWLSHIRIKWILMHKEWATWNLPTMWIFYCNTIPVLELRQWTLSTPKHNFSHIAQLQKYKYQTLPKGNGLTGLLRGGNRDCGRGLLIRSKFGILGEGAGLCSVRPASLKLNSGIPNVSPRQSMEYRAERTNFKDGCESNIKSREKERDLSQS